MIRLLGGLTLVVLSHADRGVMYGFANAQANARAATIAVLTADGRVTLLSESEGIIPRDLARVEGFVPGPWQPPHRLLARVGSRLALLSVGDRSIRIVGVDHPAIRYPLPDSVNPIALTEGSDRGRALLVGTVGERPVITTVDSQGISPFRYVPTRDQRVWYPMGAWALDSTDSLVAVSYHGTHMDGAELVSMGSDLRLSCPISTTFATGGCLLGHGMVAMVDDGIVLAIGGPLLSVSDRRGNFLGAVTTELSGHAMELSSWANSRSVAYLTPCGFWSKVSLAVVTLPALTTLPPLRAWPSSLDKLPRIAAEVRHAPGYARTSSGDSARLCGDRVIAISNGSLAVLQNDSGRDGASGVVLFIDRELTKVTRSFTFDTPILDAVEFQP